MDGTKGARTAPPSRPGQYWRGVFAGLVSQPRGSSRAFGWLAMYALARILVVRRIGRRLARTGPRAVPEGPRSIFDTDAAGIAEALRKDGFDARLRLPPAILPDLASLGEGMPGAPGSSPFSKTEGTGLALAETLADDLTLRRIAALYLGGVPVYRGSRVWWIGPGDCADPRETGARFHYDLYDYRALTFLFYLTDVGPETAPHVCVRASHRLRRWKDQIHPRRHRSDERVVRSYGEDSVVTILGPAGTGIAEDPFCFHKVKLPAKGRRLALQLLYTGRDVPAPAFNRVGASRQGV